MNPALALISYLKPADANSYTLLPSNTVLITYTSMEGCVEVRSAYRFRSYYGRIKLTDKWTHICENATYVYFCTAKEECDSHVY